MVSHRIRFQSYNNPFCQIRFIFMLFMLSFLSSCTSHITKHDGPPNYYVDETKVPDATPKPEPLAKYGNMETYRVFGKRYHVLKSSRNFEEVGIASWYGTQFHDRRTSSGERYDMLAMTAAHRYLPLPTYVQVTNLKNNRKVIVKVNDRGPFESNRIIDLSYVAAKKLGMLGHGTAKVKITAIDPYDYAHGKSPTLYADNTKQIEHKIAHSTATKSEKNLHLATMVSSKYKHGKHQVYLNIGFFKHKAPAEKLKQRLVAVLKAPIIISIPVNSTKPINKQNLYRVDVGPIRDLATANKISKRLKQLGVTSKRHLIES